MHLRTLLVYVWGRPIHIKSLLSFTPALVTGMAWLTSHNGLSLGSSRNVPRGCSYWRWLHSAISTSSDEPCSWEAETLEWIGPPVVNILDSSHLDHMKYGSWFSSLTSWSSASWVNLNHTLAKKSHREQHGIILLLHDCIIARLNTYNILGNIPFHHDKQICCLFFGSFVLPSRRESWPW